MKDPFFYLGQAAGAAVLSTIVYGLWALIGKVRSEGKPSMREVIREVDAILAGNPKAGTVRAAILADLKSHERGILAQLRHGKVTAQEVATRFAGKAI